MKERPILFSGEMVRAILDGRKTQTRRIIKPQPGQNSDAVNKRLVQIFVDCPFGQPGDRLWVRESGWQPRTPSIDDLAGGADTWPGYAYDADGISEGDREDYQIWGWKRRPSIYMPRWASRITLEITGVRVERVQNISSDDAVAEGVPRTFIGNTLVGAHSYARVNYRQLWDSLNAKRGYGWDVNPWVWVIEFKKLEDLKAVG